MGRKKFASPAGNRTPVSRVTGGDTYHYTTEDTMINRKLECVLWTDWGLVEEAIHLE